MNLQKNVEKSTLRVLASTVWYTGFMALSIKSYKLFVEAYALNNNVLLLSAIIFFAFVIALLKTRFIFIKVCKKNLTRISLLENPKIWQFYRVQFFIFLISMISLGAYLSHFSHGNYIFLVSVGVIDMSVGLALLFSSFVFWTFLR